MSGAIFIFVSLAAFGNLADFIIGERGREGTRKRLVDWYVALSIESWLRLSFEAADAVDRFLAYLLGGRVASPKGLIRVLMFTAAFDSALIVVAYLLTLPTWHVSPWSVLRNDWFFAPAIIFSNTIVSAIALSLTRLMYKGLDRTRTLWAIASLTIAEAAIAYLAAFATTLLTAATAVTLHSCATPHSPCTPREFVDFLYKPLTSWTNLRYWLLRAPFHGIGRIYVSLALFTISAVLPSILHFATLLFLFVFAISKPLLERPVTLLLERLYESPKGGVFTIVGSVFGALAGLLTHLSALLK